MTLIVRFHCSALVIVFFNNKFNTFFGLNLTLVYTFPMCMAWRFHFPIRNYDFKYLTEYVSTIPLMIMPGFAERCRYTYLSEIHWPPTQTHEVHIKVSVITFMSPFFNAKIKEKSNDAYQLETTPLHHSSI